MGQEEDLKRRLALVEGLEKEKQAVAKQQKEIEKQRDELKLLERRLRSSSGPVASGPPVLSELRGSWTSSPPTPPLLPGRDRSLKPRQTSAFRVASMAALSPTNSPMNGNRSRTPPPSCHRFGA